LTATIHLLPESIFLTSKGSACDKSQAAVELSHRSLSVIGPDVDPESWPCNSRVPQVQGSNRMLARSYEDDRLMWAMGLLSVHSSVIGSRQ